MPSELAPPLILRYAARGLVLEPSSGEPASGGCDTFVGVGILRRWLSLLWRSVMVSLYEKHRPKRLSDVAGHRNALRKLVCLNKTCGLRGQVLWVTGPSGCGKTTIARAVAECVSDEALTYEIDAQDLSLDQIREWEDKASHRPLWGEGYCFIVNEAHALSQKAVSRLLTVLEMPGVSKFSTWVFTTTDRGQQLLLDDKFDAAPFLSRAVPIRLELDVETVQAMAQRLQDIARSESLDGQPVEAYVSLLKTVGFNMRAALQSIATGEMLV